MRGNVKKVCKE